MIHLIRRLLDFSGKERNALIVSFIFSLLNAIFEMLPIIAILTVVVRDVFNSGWRLDVCFDSMEIFCHYAEQALQDVSFLAIYPV